MPSISMSNLAKCRVTLGSRRFELSVFACVTSLLLVSPPVSAQNEEEGVFTYAFRGLGVGAPVGAAAGYLLTRDDDWSSDDWKDVGTGVAIGAITGAVGGIAIGITDLSDGRMGMGATVLRDTWYGTLLGITVGAIVGGVLIMDSGDGKDLLGGMAWGAVIGAPVGLGVGFIEAGMRGQMGMAGERRYAGVEPTDVVPVASTDLRFALVPTRTAHPPDASVGEQELVWVPTVYGSF